MGKVRVCGKQCHNAKRANCKCWCGGLFHGSAGKESREAFAREFRVDDLPTTESAFDDVVGQRDLFSDGSAGDRWRDAIRAAVSARSSSLMPMAASE